MRGTKQGRSPSELFRYLSAKWPKAFNPKAPRPLKIGIHHDIRALDGDLSDDELSTAMRAYTKIGNYLSKLRAGAVRVDLNGKPAGEVSEADAAAANALMHIRNLRRRAAQTPPKGDAESQSKPEPKQALTLKTKIAAGRSTGVVVETKRRRSFQKPTA
ncbi:ProQ/FinO family protein [Chelativorans salis]|uniref:ProQ/FinO family protein n=1 Tax=Chelativorans salis TaxID=2978478 RepID=A0ABT2LTU8_9HYPH|nr:ProQ/FinO family protein [Chelativorans sp. EGI FJ00035]MCT7377961.1 ProQ/FinO family protein [Chelativorans sp. EGI FJ00035]